MGGTTPGQRALWSVLRTLVALLCLAAGCASSQTATPHLWSASAIAFDTAGNLFIADARAHQVLESTLAGTLRIVAGTGTQGFAGDGGPALAAQLNEPQGLALAADGTLYIADTGNDRIRAVSPAGTISTVAGSGQSGSTGLSAAATAVRLNGPTALALDSTGALLLCDTRNHRVLRLTAGHLSLVAGTGTEGYAGEGGPATAATFDTPEGVATDSTGRIFLADTHNHRIRIISPSGLITTFAGTGTPGFSGDGGAATAAQLTFPRGLALDAAGNLLVADTGNRRIRLVNPAGAIVTQAGVGTQGTAGDAAALATGMLQDPRSVAVSSLGFTVLADTANAMVHEVVSGAMLYNPAGLATGRSTTLTPGPSVAAVYGQASATASLAGPVMLPAGTLEAVEGATLLAQTTLSSGKATLDLTSLSAGTHSLTLSYLGDGLNPSTQASLAAVITPAPVTASAQATTVSYGQPLPTLTGGLAGVLPADAGQVGAQYSVATTTLPPVGNYPIQATLTGARAANYALTLAPGSGQLSITKATTTAQAAPVSQAFAGLPIALTATVTPAAKGQPTGTLQFLDGNTIIATSTLSNGVASATYPSASAGQHTLTVQYLGDSNFLPSASPATTISVAALPDFAVATASSSAASTAAGSSAIYSLTVSAQPGPFTGAVSLSAQGLPTGVTATFSPPQVVPGTGAATVTVTLQTSAVASTAALQHTRPRATALAVLLLLLPSAAKRRRTPVILFFALLSAAVLCGGLSGCGARSVGEGLGGTLAQTYSLQITGTATNLAGQVVTHSVPLTLTIHQ